MTGNAAGAGVDEQCTVGANTGDGTCRWLGARAAEREVAGRVARELVVGERACRASGSTEGRNDGGEHVDTVRAEREAGTVELGRRTHVDADADGDPVEPRATPPRLDKHARQLPLAEVDVIGPLEPRLGAGERLERGREREGETEG